MKITVYGASSNVIEEKYILGAFNLGKEIAKRNHTLVFGGGATGVMGASASGATSMNGKVIGISPKFFNVDGVLFQNCTELIFTEDMRERKKLLEEVDGFVICPGGAGTLDEFFEILTLKQLGLTNKPIAFFNIDGFYDDLFKMMEHAKNEKCLKQATIDLYKSFTSVNDILDYLENYDEPLKELTFYKSVNKNIK